MTTWPHAEHETCRDWSAQPFPWRRHRKLLERCVPAVRGDDRKEVLRVVRALVALERRWPADALAVLDEGRALLRAVRLHLDGAPAKLRAQL